MKTLSHVGLFSKSSLARKPSAIRALHPFLKLPNVLNLGGGMPNEGLFPFAGLQVSLSTGEVVDVDILVVPFAVIEIPVEVGAKVEVLADVECCRRWMCW